MDWIKVTPETMPPDMELVFLTVQNDEEERYVIEGRWNPTYKAWE